MHLFEYKNHVIYPTPRRQIGTGSWKVQLSIRHKNNIKIFSHDDYYSTESEAVFNTIKYGKHLIDTGVKIDNEKHQSPFLTLEKTHL